MKKQQYNLLSIAIAASDKYNRNLISLNYTCVYIIKKSGT